MSANSSENIVRDEPAIELKFGQIGIANLRLKLADPGRLETELAEKVAAAPALFRYAPVVLDLSHLPQLPARSEAAELLDAIRRAGMLPVGLAYGTSETEALARQLDLPLLAKFRSNYESAAISSAARDDGHTTADSGPAPAASSTLEPAAAPDLPPTSGTAPTTAGMLYDQPVRSGQQVYARARDLILMNVVGNGAEVIADGSIHVYGALRGRALAGALGDIQARIICQAFHAELLSIAGHYRVFEEIPRELHGKPVQAWLEGEKLHVERLRI